MSGCPVAISSRAGVCQYLDEAHPGLPYIKIDFDDFYSAIPAVQAVLADYDGYRAKLASYVARLPLPSKQSANFAELYGGFLSMPPRHAVVTAAAPRSAGVEREAGTTIPAQVNGSTASGIQPRRNHALVYGHARRSYRTLVKRGMLSIARRMMSERALRRMSSFARSPVAHMKGKLKERIKSSGIIGEGRYVVAVLDAWHLAKRMKDIARLKETSLVGLRAKLAGIYHAADNPLFRCNFWMEIARIERVRGNDLIAVAYELRIMRLLGEDRLGFLPMTTDTLRKHGMPREAEAAEAMYGDPAASADRVHAYLSNAYQRHLHCQARAFEHVDDRRNGDAKVSVIVSLYKAAAKLPFFITAIRQQTLNRDHLVEFVFIDSGSPHDERAVFEQMVAQRPLNAVFARSMSRETIQAAWNRGIGLAKAPYLVFLGVDESLYPEALAVLADHLDRNPDTDWVMANSLVTAVEDNGVYKHDIMTYDRRGANKDHAYLETCYISYVGGIYRRSLHARHGYYDESFTGAGDTEFKNRILPHIQVDFLPANLGIFLNYPDDRTTASPRVEIEDIRAWYMHRTAGGIRYAFEKRPVADAEALLAIALGYRKSFCGHYSSDIEYAAYLVDYISNRDPASHLARAISGEVNGMLTRMRSLEFAETMPRPLSCVRRLISDWRAAVRSQAAVRRTAGATSLAHFAILNDNRFEQHSWLWKTIQDPSAT